MTVSQNRRDQIEAQLAKHGITATDEAVNAVIEILKSDQRATVASATRRYAATVNPEVEAQTVSQSNQSAFGDATQNLKTAIKTKIVNRAFREAIEEIKDGDFSDVELETIDVDFSEVFDHINFFGSSQKSLPSSPNSLPTSEEIFNAEVLAQ